MQCLEGICSGIQDLNLTGLPDNRVVVRRLPHDGEVYYAGVTVHPVQETYHTGTNARESIGYGCAITMVVNNDLDKDLNLDRLLLWRESIRRYFVENSTLSSVTSGVACTLKVEMGKTIDDNELIKGNYDVSVMVVRAYVLETRT